MVWYHTYLHIISASAHLYKLHYQKYLCAFYCTYVWVLPNEKLNDLYSSPNIVRVIKSRRMRCVEHVARMGAGRGVYRVLVGKPEGRRPLGRPKLRLEDNIKMDLQEVGYGVWIGLSWLSIGIGSRHL